MENLEVIIQAEINIPKSYLNCQITSWGRMNSLLSHYKDSVFYLYSSNPEAISIYNKLGFKGQNFKSWWAIKGELPEWCQ